MNGYKNISRYYSILFPLSDVTKGFMKIYVENCCQSTLPWLDVGCGTGVLLEWLLEKGIEVYGMDLDKDFVKETRNRLSLDDEYLKIGGMTDLNQFEKQFGVITCLGNVLAHASNEDVIRDFFRNTRDRLTKNSALIIQIVNYDKVLASVEWNFPVIKRTAPDGTFLVFERFYRMENYSQGEKLRFDTVLHVGDKVFENTTLLYPIKKNKLVSLAKETFSDIQVFGDFKGTLWSKESPATILTAK